MCTAPVFDNYNYSHPVTPHFAVHCLIIDLMILCVLGGGGELGGGGAASQSLEHRALGART